MRRSLVGFLIGTITGLLWSVAAWYDLFPEWRARLGDLFHITGRARAPVTIIAIDLEALQQYGRPDEWSAEQYEALFQRARETGVRVVALDFPPPLVIETTLTNTVPNGLIVWPAVGVGTPSLQAGSVSFPYLLRPSAGAHTNGSKTLTNLLIGHINLIPDSDGVLRRVPLWVQSDTGVVPGGLWLSTSRPPSRRRWYPLSAGLASP
jgi:CHASE2 domain-containing sensor protein